MLNESQKAQFWKDGYLVVPDAVSEEQLAALKADFDGWVEESRAHEGDYGVIQDGRARFDVETGHSAEAPKLRRVAAPTEVSKAYLEVCCESAMTDMVADLIGPNVKLHHTKINSKQPGSYTEVKWHQDFPFTPHTNDDIVTALLFVDDVTLENGPLEVAPGTHRDAIEPIWHNEKFTGAVSEERAKEWAGQALQCAGPGGSVCFMHTRLGHGSAPNNSAHPRTLFISVYTADDAVALSKNPVPTEHEGMLVRGERTGRIRSMDYQVRIPEYPKTTSFFEQQEDVT